ncbi:hypothetical protein [uncultured Psychrobacter sp.]|uniref:hypothetical protein n=1 Tax=uncultured Psychrobacter sp. TaxID=259303 RepID=UPI0030DDAC92
MSDLIERTSETTVQDAIALLKPMVQTKAYVDVLAMLALQPEGFDLDFTTFDAKQLTDLQEYNASRFDRREMITDAIYSIVPDACEYDASEFEACFTQVVTEINEFAAKNPNITYLNAAVHVCKAAAGEQIVLSNGKRDVTKIESDFWGYSTTYRYEADASAFDRSFKVDAKIVKFTYRHRSDIKAVPVGAVKYGCPESCIQKYLTEVIEDYCYAWVHILHEVAKK